VFVLELFSTLPNNGRQIPEKTNSIYKYNISALPCWKRRKEKDMTHDWLIAKYKNKRGKDKNVKKNETKK
jgi:hypothetical protein